MKLADKAAAVINSNVLHSKSKRQGLILKSLASQTRGTISSVLLCSRLKSMHQNTDLGLTMYASNLLSVSRSQRLKVLRSLPHT